MKTMIGMILAAMIAAGSAHADERQKMIDSLNIEPGIGDGVWRV